MPEHNHDSGRRYFLRNGLIALAAVPAGALIAGAARPARAADAPKVSMDDPAASALKYHKDATKAQGAGRGQDEFCHNCQLYTGKSGAQWGGCNAIPGDGLVSADGWCSAWVSAG